MTFFQFKKKSNRFINSKSNLYIVLAIYVILVLFALIKFYILSIIGFSFIVYYIINNRKKIKEYETSKLICKRHEDLQKFIWKYDSKVNLLVDLGCDEYNAHANPKKREIILNKKWFYEIFEEEIKEKYVECTLLHELYHIKSNKNLIENIIAQLSCICPTKNLKKKLIISNWMEELSADRYAHDQYNNSDIFMECIEFKKNSSKRNKSCCTHPSWDIRYKFIKENIPVTYKNVEKEYIEWQKSK